MASTNYTGCGCVGTQHMWEVRTMHSHLDMLETWSCVSLFVLQDTCHCGTGHTGHLCSVRDVFFERTN